VTLLITPRDTVMGKPIIEINGISKCYRLGQFGFSSFREESEKFFQRLRGKKVEKSTARDFWALRDISFAVEPGEVVGIIGRNGAGKSTLLKILSRITEPSHGEILLRGRVASLLEVGTGFHPELSGRENIFLNGAILGMTKSEIARKFDEIVAFAEIDKFIDTPVKRYSSGMYVKLAFAVAAHLEPEILIVDEVLAVGDAAFQRKSIGRMKEVSRQGRTVLFVSHNLGLVRNLCSRGILIRDGKVACDGPVATALSEYASNSGQTGKRTPRAGEEFLLQEVRVLDDEGGASGVVICGKPFTIEVRCIRPHEASGFYLRILDSDGLTVAVLNSAFAGDGDTPGSDWISVHHCWVEFLNLVPGNYNIDAELWLPTGCVDRWQNATTLTIGDGLIAGRLAKSDRAFGMTILPHRWIAPASGNENSSS